MRRDPPGRAAIFRQIVAIAATARLREWRGAVSKQLVKVHRRHAGSEAGFLISAAGGRMAWVAAGADGGEGRAQRPHPRQRLLIAPGADTAAGKVWMDGVEAELAAARGGIDGEGDEARDRALRYRDQDMVAGTLRGDLVQKSRLLGVGLGKGERSDLGADDGAERGEDRRVGGLADMLQRGQVGQLEWAQGKSDTIAAPRLPDRRDPLKFEFRPAVGPPISRRKKGPAEAGPFSLSLCDSDLV